MESTPAASAPAVEPAMAFALMRNSHEALKSAIRVMDCLLGDIPNFTVAWQDYKRAIHVHSEMEDCNMFPLLDKLNGSELNLHHLHVEDEKFTKSVDDALTANEQSSIVDSFKAWKDFHLEHFSNEETVMMPLTMKTAPTPKERAIVVHKELVTTAMERNADEFIYYIGWCCDKLNIHGSAQFPPPNTEKAVKVFVRAVHSASSEAQWKRLSEVVSSNISREVWSDLVENFKIDIPVDYL